MGNEKDIQKIDPLALAQALKAMPPEELKSVLTGAGIAPSTIGWTTEQLQVIMGGMTKVSADAQKEALRSQRRENPYYPEKSVFNPRGSYADDGALLAPKIKFRIPTKYNGVRLGGELETEQEIELCNRITESKYAREGTWKAEILGQGINQRLEIVTPSMNADERNAVGPFTLVLLELIEGKSATTPENLQKQLFELQQKVTQMEAQKVAEAVA